MRRGKMPRGANIWLVGWTTASFLMCIIFCLIIAVCLTYVMDFILTFIDIPLMGPVMWLVMVFHMLVGLSFLLLIVISNTCCGGKWYKTACCCHILSVLFAHLLHLLWIILIIVMLFPALLVLGVHFACVYVPSCIHVTDFGLQADFFEQYDIEGVLAAINNFNTSSLYGLAGKLEKMFVHYLDEVEDSEWLDSLLTTVETSAVAKMNSSTFFNQIDESTDYVFEQFDVLEGKSDRLAEFLNHTAHAKTDTLLSYVDQSLIMLDDKVLDSDLLTRLYNTSYQGHIREVAAYIDDVTSHKISALETLLEKKNVTIPGISSLNLNRLMELPKLANISLPKGVLESLPETGQLDLLLELLKVNASLSNNALAALPESAQLDVMLQFLKRNVSLPQDALASFSNSTNLDIVRNLLQHNATLPLDALPSLPDFVRQDVVMHLLKNNLTLPTNAFASLQETARADVLLDMLRSNVTLPKDALDSIPKSPKVYVLLQILSKNMSLPENPLASVPEAARLEVMLHLLKNNVSLPEDPLPSLPASARLNLLKHFSKRNISIPDDAFKSLPNARKQDVLFMLIRNNISLSDTQVESLNEFKPETTNLTGPELFAASGKYPFSTENDTSLVVLELLRNESDDFQKDLLTFDVMKYLKDIEVKTPQQDGNGTYPLPGEFDDLLKCSCNDTNDSNITCKQKQKIMGKLRKMANEATVMAILASEEARKALRKAVEMAKKGVDYVDKNSEMLAKLAKEKAQQAAEKAKAAAKWALNKAKKGLLKVQEVGKALIQGAWETVKDLALNCRRYASAAFDGARAAIRTARKSVKYVVKLADRALVYFRKGYAYVRNFCDQLGLRKRSVGVYCADAKDYYCKKIAGSAFRLIVVFFTSILLNITLVNYMISLSASVITIAFARKKKKRRRIYSPPIQGSVTYQMAETGSFSMIT